MSKTMNMLNVLAVVCIMLNGCEHRMEKDFFRKPLGNRLERLRQYCLENQYKIFRYGNDVVEPPLTDLANPIAERGAESVPFLLNRLDSESDDISARDILLIFEKMTYFKSYDVKSDMALMSKLTSRVSVMKDKGWQSTCRRKIQNIKDSG